MAKRKPAPKPESSSSSEEQQEPQHSEEEEEEEEEEEGGEEESEEEEEVSGEEEEAEEEEEEEEEQQEEEDSSRDSLRTLLEPFSKDQLLELLKESALKNPSILARISASADSDPVQRKIFVHGLSWDCTTDTLTTAFAPFGDIEDCRVIVDKATNRSKGYGFVLFRTRAGARNALKEPQKTIGGRSTSCQLASAGAPKGSAGNMGLHSAGVPEPTGRKIFVRDIPENANIERLRSFFGSFGEIEEGPVGYDRATGKLRGFAIFVYKTVEGCKKALEEPDKVFEGSWLRCQRAFEGLNKAKTAAAPFVPPMPAAAHGFLQSNNLALAYTPTAMMGMNPLAMNPGAGVGFLNQAVGISPSVNRIGSGVNTVSPSVIGNYQSPSALQALGTYQGSQSNSTMEPGTSSQLGIGSFAAGFPSYFGR